MVVFTTRRETQAMLGRVLAAEGISHGFISGGAAAANQRTIEAFRKERPDIHVIVSTDAGAEGVNLQMANILVNYDLPWNPMVVEQRIGRVQRIGSKFKSVWVANIVHDSSPEQKIVARLMEKLQIIAHTVGDIEAVLEAANDSDGKSLEEQIRNMVVAALCGRDQERAAAMQAESIDQARKLLEEQQEQMNDLLGAMNFPDQADIPMPRLAPVTPSISLEEFVLLALNREGHKVRDDGSGLYKGRDGNNDRVQFTFDSQVLEAHTLPGVFGGNVPQIYQPGKPAFERLVQRWVGQSAVHGEDKRCTASDAATIASRWVGSITGASFLRVQIAEGSASIGGRVLCRSRAFNAVDSYEKIVAVTVDSPLDARQVPFDPVAAVNPKTIFSHLEALIDGCVSGDQDIQKFRHFYEQRLQRELVKTDTGPRREKLVNDLSPSVTAETAAFEYTIRGVRILDVAYQIGGAGEYRTKIAVENGVVKSEPRLEKCELTSSTLPDDCLEICQVTGKRGLRHLMQKSDLGGGYALPDKCVTCALTGRQILETEAEKCCLTGQIASRSALIRSEASGRYVVPNRATACEVTRSTVVDDELVNSIISGKWFRRDEAVLLADGVSAAHRTEAKRCEFSGFYLPLADCIVSSYSGKTMSKGRVAKSALSNRECDTSELEQCGESGLHVLPDELVECAVSGKRILEGLTAVCPETHACASKSLFAECDETKAKVLPSGLAECCITEKRVRKSLLAASAASGRAALARHMCRCEETGAMLLPDESGQSGLSQRKVDKRLLRQCVISGRIGTKSELIKSAISGRWMLPQHAIALPDGQPAGAHETTRCQWTDNYLPISATAVCILCGLPFDKRVLNASGEFAVLREILDGKRSGDSFPDQGYLARTCPELFRGVQGAHFVSSASKKAHVLYGVKSFFGLKRRVFGVVTAGEMSGMKPIGKAMFGKQAGGVWTATEIKEIE
jgi:hypothetical protein